MKIRERRGQSLLETLAVLPVIFLFCFSILSAFDAAITAIAADHALEELLLCGTAQPIASCVLKTTTSWASARRATVAFTMSGSSNQLSASASGRCLLGWKLKRNRELAWPPSI